ncbi:MAG: nitroreductase family protein [Bacteroidales bacterium]|nr:nitroreductase family protein [Bacteroidales bacterium]
MTFLELVKKRQSVRKYVLEKPIEAEKLDRILEAAQLAPSASNSQPWTFIVVNEPELTLKVAKATRGTLIGINKFVAQAPLLIVMVIEKPKITTQIGGTIKNKEYPLIDIGIAAEHMCLQAEEDGIGSCMLGWFDENRIKKLLNIPLKKTIGLVISFGYAPHDYPLRVKIRKNINQIVKINSYL